MCDLLGLKTTKMNLSGKFCLRKCFRFICSRRFRSTFVLSVFCFAVLVTYTVISEIFQPEYIYVNRDIESECVIPKLDPFDPSMMQYYYKLPSMSCDETPALMVVDVQGVLKFNKKFKEEQKHTMTCTYSIIERVDDFKVNFKPEVKFLPPVDIPSDFFFVSCKDMNNKSIYESLHTKIYSKNMTFNKDNRRVRPNSQEDLSVIIFGIDSVSQLAAHRSLPKSLEYLQNTLKGYVFKGFNKVGGSTHGNMVPLFTGSLRESKGVDYLATFKNYSKRGYVTMHGEDLPFIVPKVFKDPPTDHYLRPFYIAKKDKRPIQLSMDATFYFDHVFKYIEHKSFKIGKSSALCYGNRPNHMLLVDYYKQFLEAYRGNLTFSYTWLTELGHDYINMVGYADEDVYNFMKWLKDENYLENTVFILMSDHGQRINGKIRNTPMGRIEDRMPFVSMVIPEHLKQKYPHIRENLRTNTERLTSPFDLHETLMDILLKKFQKEIDLAPPETKRKPRGISLFRKIPKDRSCFEARVPDHYCACYAYKSLPVSNHKVKNIANVAVDFINQKLSKLNGKCEFLKLNRIDNAEVSGSNLERRENEERFDRIEETLNMINHILPRQKTEDTNKMYRVTIETIPGKGLFEATVKYIESNRRFEVVDRISRINRYGNQSLCVKEKPIMKTMCYCKNE